MTQVCVRRRQEIEHRNRIGSGLEKKLIRVLTANEGFIWLRPTKKGRAFNPAGRKFLEKLRQDLDKEDQ